MSRLARSAPTLLVLLLAGACSVAPVRTPSPVDSPMLTRRVLTNGVRVVVQEFHESEVVALQLWVQAGARDEMESELGLAHYLEHMLFKGTAVRAPGFVELEIEGVGGRINAGTSLDYTYYHTVLPGRRALAGVEMLADVAVNATLSENLLDLEKRVVLEEMRLGEDSPRRYLFRQLYEMLFESHPYGRPVIGTADLVRGLTRETLVSFYRRHYVPESFVLAVVGPVRTAEILASAERTFGRLPRSGFQRLPAAAPQSFRSKKRAIERPGAQAYLGMGWHAPKLDHADTPVVDLLTAILGQSRSSRLTQALRERRPLVAAVGAGYSPLEAAGAIVVTAQLDPGNLEQAEAAVLEEIRRVRERGVSAAELRRAVTAAEARHEFSSETAEGRASRFGRAETVWRLDDEIAYINRLRSVTREQIRVAARRYLDLQRYTRLALVPKPR